MTAPLKIASLVDVFHLLADVERIPTLRRAVKDFATSGGLSSMREEWSVVALRDLFRTRSGNSKLIKGKLHDAPGPGRFPGYSASGQDVWLDSWEHDGDAVILSAVGARCGKAFKAKEKWSAIANTHIVWPDPARITLDFAHLLLNDERFWIRSGGAQPFVKVGATLERTLRIPPLAEQKRIVAKVDELMGLIDDLEAKQTKKREVQTRFRASALDALTKAEGPEELAVAWKRVAGNLDVLFERADALQAFRLAVLGLAVRGRLVPQASSDEPAIELLARLHGRRRATVEADDRRPAPFSLPPGWAWATLPELGEFGRGRSKHRPRNDPSLFSGGRFPLVQTGDVARSRGAVTTFGALYNERGLAQSRLWPKGTLCITIAANIADTGVLTFDACFPDSVVGFIPDSEIGEARYFDFFLRTAQSEIETYAPSTAQKNINLEILSKVLVPLPPVAEMQRIVTKVEAVMNLCDELEAKLRAKDEAAAKLADAVVRELVS